MIRNGWSHVNHHIMFLTLPLSRCKKPFRDISLRYRNIAKSSLFSLKICFSTDGLNLTYKHHFWYVCQKRSNILSEMRSVSTSAKIAGAVLRWDRKKTKKSFSWTKINRVKWSTTYNYVPNFKQMKTQKATTIWIARLFFEISSRISWKEKTFSWIFLIIH